MTFQEYLDLHGITQKSVEKFDLVEDNGKLVIPIKDSDNQFIYNKYRNLNFDKGDANTPKYTFDKDSHPTLFNLASIKDSSYVVITEGEIDAIRLDQEGICAVSSTAGALTFKEEWATYFQGKNVFICFDSDEAGKKGAIKTATQVLPTARIISLPEETKDVCEFFQSNHKKEDFFALVKEARMTPLLPVITGKELLNTPYPEESYIIEKILPEQSITLLVGEAGTFKSFLSLAISRHLVTQEPFLGHFQVMRKCKILVIDKENKLRRVKQRMEGLNFPKTKDLFFLQYPDSFMFDNDNFVTQIAAFIEQQKIDVVILDSFIDMFEGNENSSTDTAAAFNGMRSLSGLASFIVLHHDSKPMPKTIRTAGQKTRGSSNIIAQVDTQFYLEKGKNLKSFTVEQGKSRDDEPIKKFSVGVVSDPDTGSITNFTYQGEFKDTVSRIEEAKEALYAFIKLHPMCTKDDAFTFIQSDTDLTGRTLKDGLESLMKSKILEFTTKPGSGRKHYYFISENDDEEENEEDEI